MRGALAKGSRLLPINQCAALLPERTKDSAGRSMASRCTTSNQWHSVARGQDHINVNLLLALPFPLEAICMTANQLWFYIQLEFSIDVNCSQFAVGVKMRFMYQITDCMIILIIEWVLEVRLFTIQGNNFVNFVCIQILSSVYLFFFTRVLATKSSWNFANFISPMFKGSVYEI